MKIKEDLTLNFACEFTNQNELEIFSNNIKGFLTGSLQALSKTNDIKLSIGDSFTKKKIIEDNIISVIEKLN